MSTVQVMMVVQPTNGGAARHVLELAHGCADRGVGMRVVCGAKLPGLRPTIPVDLLPMGREIAPLGDLDAVRRLRRLVAARRPDIVHLHSSKAGAVGRAAIATMPGRPAVVFTPHLYAFVADATWRARWYRWLEVAMAPWTDLVIAVSESEADAAARTGVGHRVTVVRNGVALRPATARARRPPPSIGWLGRIADQKQASAAVTTSLVLDRLGVSHRLVIGGDGPDLERIRTSIAEAGAPWIEAIGFVEDTAAFHASVDVLLITSRAEGLPYVGLDAMAHGVPIVGYDVPGVRDLVQHGVTGLLAPAGDPGALAAQLARLCRDSAWRRAMGAAARERARRTFPLDEQIDLICGHYRALAARRRGLES